MRRIVVMMVVTAATATTALTVGGQVAVFASKDWL
jgi:hypothetical protein